MVSAMLTEWMLYMSSVSTRSPAIPSLTFGFYQIAAAESGADLQHRAVCKSSALTWTTPACAACRGNICFVVLE